MRSAREGAQMAGAKQVRNLTPSVAIRSMFGVFAVPG
jgi:hypothetical protein